MTEQIDVGFCTSCGLHLDPKVRSCARCGAPVPHAPAQSAAPAAPSAQNWSPAAGMTVSRAHLARPGVAPPATGVQQATTSAAAVTQPAAWGGPAAGTWQGQRQPRVSQGSGQVIRVPVVNKTVTRDAVRLMLYSIAVLSVVTLVLNLSMGVSQIMAVLGLAGGGFAAWAGALLAKPGPLPQSPALKVIFFVVAGLNVFALLLDIPLFLVVSSLLSGGYVAIILYTFLAEMFIILTCLLAGLAFRADQASAADQPPGAEAMP